MVLYPNAKINIGLNILRKRQDGYHDIETIMYPLRSCYDTIEIDEADTFCFSQDGILIDCLDNDNLVVKAYRLLQSVCSIPPVSIELHKHIPFGAGLGGGSADAAFTLRGLRDMFRLPLSDNDLIELSATLGSDCPFFIYNSPCLATGRGEQLQPISLNLDDYEIRLVKPAVNVSTVQAYKGVTPRTPTTPLLRAIDRPINEWKGIVENDFERHILPLYPDIALAKQTMYQQGAIFALMSGSGSSVFGIFEKRAIDI